MFTASDRDCFGITSYTIKLRWSSIFERVASINSSSAPLRTNARRQKRQRILPYVRSHPQELRPFRGG